VRNLLSFAVAMVRKEALLRVHHGEGTGPPNDACPALARLSQSGICTAASRVHNTQMSESSIFPWKSGPSRAALRAPNQDRPSGLVYRLGLAAPLAPSTTAAAPQSRFPTDANPCCWQRASSHRIISRKASRIELRGASGFENREAWRSSGRRGAKVGQLPELDRCR
jgi:hypothetical protein